MINESRRVEPTPPDAQLLRQSIRPNAANVSRRHFIARTGVITLGACLSPKRLFAEVENIVATARKRAESAAITIQPLRGNISALIGSGGNIAVLTGADGKLI